MSDREALQGFLAKWRARWPEWTVAEAFVPAAQRERAQAWLALRDELAEAAWAAKTRAPAMPSSAGGRRNWTAGRAAQGGTRSAWSCRARRLAGTTWRPACLRSPTSRERPASLEASVFALEPYAEAIAAVAQRLFASASPAPARNVVISLLAERVLHHPDGATPLGDPDVRRWARGLLERWPPPAGGTRPGRIHAAIVRARLRRYARGGEGATAALPTLWSAWRAARG